MSCKMQDADKDIFSFSQLSGFFMLYLPILIFQRNGNTLFFGSRKSLPQTNYILKPENAFPLENTM